MAIMRLSSPWCWSNGAVGVLLIVCYTLQASVVSAAMDNMALCNAVQSGSLARVQDYLDKMKPDVNVGCTFANAKYPLDVAAKNGFVDIARVLIESGGDVNQTGILGYTPLLHASDSLHPDVMELLLENDADINALLLPIQGVVIGTGDDIFTPVTVGMNAMTLAAAAYLRTYPFVSIEEKDALQITFYKIVDILFKYCFDFVDDVQTALTRLISENFMEEWGYINNKSLQYQPGC